MINFYNISSLSFYFYCEYSAAIYGVRRRVVARVAHPVPLARVVDPYLGLLRRARRGYWKYWKTQATFLDGKSIIEHSFCHHSIHLGNGNMMQRFIYIKSNSLNCVVVSAISSIDRGHNSDTNITKNLSFFILIPNKLNV